MVEQSLFAIFFIYWCHVLWMAGCPHIFNTFENKIQDSIPFYWRTICVFSNFCLYTWPPNDAETSDTFCWLLVLISSSELNIFSFTKHLAQQLYMVKIQRHMIQPGIQPKSVPKKTSDSRRMKSNPYNRICLIGFLRMISQLQSGGNKNKKIQTWAIQTSMSTSASVLST